MSEHPIGLTAAEQARRSGQVARAMAACIAQRATIHRAGRPSPVLPEDLERDGFTRTEVARYWGRARELAGELLTSLPEMAALAAFAGFVGCVALSFGGA